MCHIMTIDDSGPSLDDLPYVSCDFRDPHTKTCGTSSKTSGIISVDIRVFIIPKTVDFIDGGLCNTCSRVDSINEFTWERLRVTLSSREIIVIMIKTRVKACIVSWDA